MADITIQYNNLFSLGYISCNVPEDIMAISRQEIDNMLKANFKSVVGVLKGLFTFQNILQIMIFTYSLFESNKLELAPYVDFIITSVKARLNLNIQYFSVN